MHVIDPKKVLLCDEKLPPKNGISRTVKFFSPMVFENLWSQSIVKTEMHPNFFLDI